LRETDEVGIKGLRVCDDVCAAAWLAPRRS
jgi:hypothetical protein